MTKSAFAAAILALASCAGAPPGPCAECAERQSKWKKEVDLHYEAVQLKNSEIAGLRLELEQRKVEIELLRQRNSELERKLAEKK